MEYSNNPSKTKQVAMVGNSNLLPSTHSGAEEEGFPWVWGQPGFQSENLSLKTKTKSTTKWMNKWDKKN